MSGQGHARAIRPWVLVVLMVLMPQTGYLEGWPWMVVEDAEPESILPPADTTPMATYSATGYPSLDADIRSGDLSDWTFWRPNATDSTGYRGGFDTFNNALPISDGDGRAYYAGYDSGAYTSSELGGASVTDGMLLFTHYSLDSGAVHTASANLSLNLPTSAFLSFTAVTRSNGWNDSFLDIAVHQSGSQISHTVVEPSSNSLTSEQVTLFVPAGSSTVSIATSVESVTTSIHGAGGFWGVHTFSVGGFATHLSLGADHACVLAIDSDTKCWGSNTAGQLGQGHVEHMGDETDEMGQSLPYVVLPENSMASDVSAGGEHTCYILQTATSDGMPLCFGRISTLGYGWSDDGSIGDAYLEDASMMPEWPLPTGRYVTQIEAGWNHTCALFDDGSLGCWGDNAHGQLGTENTTFLGDGYDEVGDGLALVDLPSGTNVTSMALGWDHTCVLYDTGDVACWGDNSYGQLGLGHSSSVGGNTGDMGSNLVNISLPSGLNVTQLSAGDGFTCATFSDDSIRCWGRNDVGQLGQGNTAHYGDDNGETVSALSAIDVGSSYASNTKIMDAGQDHVCSVILTSSTAGVVKCWGGNGDGQLGIGTAGSDQHRGDANGEMGANLPAIGMGIDVGGDMRFEVGNQFACLMRLSSSLTNPQVQCWGISDQGRLGYGNTETLGDSSSDTLPSNDVQLALNEPFAYGDCWDIDTPTQAQVDSNDAGRHLTLLAADSACPVMAYTDDTTGTLAIAVFHQNQWVKETVTEVAGDVTDLDLGLDAEGRMFMAWAEAPTPGTASVYVAGKDRGRWASTNLTGLSGLDEVGLLLHANGDLEVVGLAADNASFASVVCTSGSDCENAGSWSSNLSRTLNGGVTLSDLDVALDRDGTAYASYQANGDLQIVSKPAGGDGIGTDDWTNHVTVRSDLGDTGSTESNALVSTVGWLSGLTTVSANLSSGGASEGLANISTCTGGWSSCAAASGWTATVSLSGVNTTLLAIDTDLDQRAYLAHLDDAGVGLTKLGPQGVLGDVETVWPHDVERVSLAIADQGTAYTAVRNQSDGTLWLVRVDAFAGRGLATDLDGDGWLGIDEMACGTDPNDDASAPMDADGDGICDGEDTTDDDLHRLGTRALALGEHFGCAITGDLHLPGVQPALLCWGANHDRQLGNMTLDTNGDNRSASSVAVDLPKWSAPIDVSAGERHACVVLTQGEVMCWGANDHGQLGRSTNFSDASVGEVDLPEGVRALSVAAGDNHTCITDQRGDAWCWGSNLNAEFGAHYAYNPNGVVPFDSIEHPSLFSEWDGSGPLSGFEHGFDGYRPAYVGCCGHQSSQQESMTFVAPYPVTLALLVTSSGFSQRFVFSVDGEEVISYTQSNSGSEVTVDLEAGHHTLTSEYLYRTGGGNGEMNYFSIRAELRGIELNDDGYGQSLPNSTQPLKQHRPSHALAGLDTSGSLTCGTDVGGNTSCTRLQFAPTSSTTMPSNSSTWQSLINNASAAPSTCAYTPSNGPDPLDVNFEPFPGISGREATMVDHATLPVECTGLRVGRNTTSSTPFDDLHAVPVEPGRSYRVSVLTTHRWSVGGGQPHLDVDLYNPKNNQRSVQTLASSVVNDVIYTVDAYIDTMIVVVRGSDCNGICAYNLRVEEVGSPLEEVSIRQVQAFEANHGLTAVGGDVMCTAGLNGVGVACQHHEQARALPVSSGLANTPLLWINETGARVRSLSVGEATACAVLDGSLACWGAEASGGLGDGGNTVSSSSNPVSVSLPAGWVPVEVAVSDHDERACALVRNATDARLVYCWGSDADGGLGDGGTFNGSEASPDTAVQHENADAERYADSFELDRQPWDVAEIVGHADFPCVRSHEGLVKCWVHPSLGRVYDAPNEMGANLPFVDLGTEVFATQLTQIQLRSSLDPQATCALLENGTVTCWGSASFSGVPATFSGYSRTSPNYVTATGDDRVVIGHGTSAGVLSDVVDIAQNCALLSNGTVRCWDPTGIRPHAEVDAGGATFVALFEGVALDSSSSGIEVCALHETLAQATCFTAPYSSNGYQPTSSREVRVATGIHDVLARRDSGGTEVTVLQGALTLTEDGSTVSAPPLKPGSLAFNRHDTAEVCGIGPDSLPFCTDEAFNTMDFGGRIEQMDKSCFLRTDAEVLCIGEPALLGQAGRAQATTSPGESLRYGTIELDLRNHDSDGDGTKDLWDADDDDDGVADWNDAFPIDPCASKDTDLDGNPDALVSNCSTVLTEDADDDNDGWSDMDEAVCDTDSTLNTQVPHDTDGDGTCDANDTDLDGDGWSNDDERACAPDQVVVRDLASFEGREGLGSVFMGGAYRNTPMLLAGESGDYAVYLLDLTASDPFTTLQNLHPDFSTHSPVGGRVSIAGDHLGVTMYEAGRTDYVAMTYDSNGTYAPTLFTRFANSPSDPFAPYLEVDGNLMFRGKQTLQPVDGPSISAPSLPYPVTVLRLPDGGLLTVGSPSEPQYDGVWTQRNGQLPLLQTWNISYSEWDDPISLNLQGGPLGTQQRVDVATKAVLDDNSTVHLVYPARYYSSSVYYQYVVMNASGLHLIGSISGGLLPNDFSSSSFGLDYTPEGGVRLSYVMSNRSVALVELNTSGSHTTTVLPGGPLDSDFEVAAVGHVTNGVGQSTVVVVPEGDSVQDHGAPLRIVQPILRFDPAVNPAWEPHDTNNDGTCDASTGAMLYFGSEDLMFEVNRFSSETPLAFGVHEVTGVTALSGLPAGLSVNSSTGAISGTPTVAVPEGVNVTLRITSNGTTTDVVVRMVINEPVLVNAPPVWSVGSHDLENVPWFATSVDGRMYTLKRGGSGTDSFGNAYDANDLLLTAYHPGGSGTVNWTTRIESYSTTFGIDLAVNPQGEPLVLFRAVHSNNHNEDNNVHLSQDPDTLGVDGVCSTPDNSTHRCTGSGNNNDRLVLVAYGLDGQVNWTQAQQYPAVNRSVTYQPDTTWGDGVETSDALSIGADGSIAVAVPFKSNAGYYRNHNTPTHPYPLGFFGGQEIEVLGSRSSSTDNRFMMLAQLSAEGEVNWVRTTETPDTTSNNQQRFLDVQLDRTSDGGVLLSYLSFGHHAWDDLVLPRLSSSSSLVYCGSCKAFLNHYMVLFDADGTPLWYQHDGVSRNQLRAYAQVLLEDDTIVIVAVTQQSQGYYHDAGVTNTTSGRPALSDSNFEAAAAFGTVAYNATSLPGDALNMFVFRASDGALTDVHSLDSNITVREGFETTGMGSGPNIRAVADGDVFHLFALSDIPGTEHRMDHWTVNGSGTVITAMATPDVASQSIDDLGRLRLGAAGFPVLQLERPYNAGGSNDPPISPYAVTWYTADGRTVAGALTDMVRFAAAQGHMIERNMPRADQSAPTPLYPDLVNRHVWSTSSDLCNGGLMGAEWSLVALNGSTWLPSGFTFDADCGKLSFSGTLSSMNVTPYWLNLSVDGRTFSHQVMVGVAPDAPTLTLPANATFTRGLSGSVFPTDLNGTGLQAARITPALPDGLTLLANGSITGNPTVNLTTTSYSVELCNDWNLCVTERITLQINEPLANLTYGGNNSLWLPRDSQVDITPVNTGGEVASFSLNGTLPLGMYFDTETGRIYGYAYLLQNTSSVNITANNSGGSFTVEVNITIPGTGITLAFPAESLSLTNGTTMQNFGGQTSGETPASWSVSPALPSGLAIGSTNGTVYGTPTVEASAADYTVTVTSTSGATATFVLNIEVLAPVEAIDLTLSTASLTLTNNTTMQPFTGQTSGDAPASWTISPNLTGGLQFGTTNGTLWGTPNATSPAVSYVITVYTAGGANDSESVTIAVVAPTISLAYPASSLSLTNGTTMQGFGAQTTGAAAASYSVSPSLPAGLSLGTSNGTLYGTPTLASVAADYTVTVTSVAGTTDTFALSIEVLDPVESITLTLPAASLSLSNNTTMQPFTGQTTGDAPSTWTISPNLTSGLQFGTTNGTLWGTPNVTSSAVTYTITVYTAGGANDSATVDIAVVAPAITLQYPATSLSLVNGTTMQSFGGQTSGAAASSFSISPALPSGLSLGSSNGTVFGTPTATASPTDHTVTVTSVAGTTATFVVNIEVIEPTESISLTLPATRLNLVNNSTMQPFTGQTTGDAPSTWTISPNLTGGLQFGTSNGTLWGTPTNASGPVDYTITVYTVSGANDSATFTVEVGPDFDGDGLPDHIDPDDDNDGLPDVDEPAGCRLNPDCDDDGYLDGIDAFPVDPNEWIDTDDDDIGNNADDDDDGDGWNETMETECGNHSDLDAFDRPSDLDGDGICDALDDVDDRPIYLSLREESLVLTVNATMTPFDVSRFGSDIRNWTVTPDLPAGLMLDDNGRLSGTPTELSNLTVYTINASNDLHWATVNLSITVVEVPPDFDSDGIPDEVDPDDDNDGFSDMTEEACGSGGRNASSVPSDIDGDDLCDAMDPDMDGDGLSNVNETNTGVWNGSNNTGTDPANPDTDGDGYCDGPLTVLVGNALFCLGGPDPNPHDPTVPADTDGDGLVDELPDGYTGLLMVDDDDDNDGFSDALEAECGSDARNSTSIPSDMDGDRLCDNIDPDSDGDGLNNTIEAELGTSNLSADTDGDGYCDGPVSPPYDDCLPGPDAFPLDPAAHRDTDGDGLPDDLFGTSTSVPMLVEDLDDDGDNWSDDDEFQCGTNSKDSTDVPVDSNDDGTCDALDTVHMLSYVFEYPTEIVDLKVDEPMTPFVPFVNGSGEVLTWELVGDLPEGLVFGESMGRQANANGAISGTPTSVTPETLFVVVWANNSAYAKAFNLSFTVYADDDNDSLPDDLPDNYPGTLRLDTDDDNDGYDDSMELTCGSNPDDPNSDPFNEDASICTGASQVIETEEGINWMLCFPCLLLLLALFLLLLLIGRDRLVVLEVGPEPENTELEPEVKAGTGTLEDPFILKPLTGVKPGDVVLSKEIVTVSNMTVESVFLMDLDESVNQRRFHMVDERNSDESLRVVPVREEGEIEVRFRFDDSMVPTLTGGTYTGLLKLGKASVYLKWSVTVEADPKALKAAEAESEAKRLAAKEAAAQRKAKEKADAKAAAAEKAQAKAEAKAAAALKKAEEETVAAKAKAEAELAEAKAEAEREIAEAKAKAAAEAQAMKAQAEAEAKAKAEQEIAEAKAKAEKEAAEVKAKAKAEAEAAEAERRRQAEAEAAERQAKMEAELEERRKRLADLDDKARKKEEELIRVAEKSKTIDFGTLGVAASTGLSEDVAKGADTLVVDDTSKFEEQGEAYIADAEGGLRIAWTGKAGSTLIGVTGLKRAFAALATVTVADDLQRIKGIGPFIEDKLHALGIYTFRQVGNMTPELEETVNVAIEFFSGRIKRDEWARQAREFEDAKDD